MKEFTVTFDEKDENGINLNKKYMAARYDITDNNLILYDQDDNIIIEYKTGEWLSVSNVV